MGDAGQGHVLYNVEERVAYITLNRPERRNAVNLSMRQRLFEFICRAREDPDVWVIVLSGTGDHAFCAGGDLKEMNDLKAPPGTPLGPLSVSEGNPYEALLETYKPTIASINGSAMGGGLELALACDMRIAADHALLGLPEAKWGLGATFGSVMLPRLLPRGIAMQMLYTGEPIGAAEGRRWGLLNAVVQSKQLPAATDAMVAQIMRNSPVTLRRYKHMVSKTQSMMVHDALRLDAGPNPYLSDDRIEGVRAYVEKRPPRWRNR